ncbi:subunit 17 of mediator complex-domain-containing protein [Podospora fimiseda]|uniref:Mediator of RNA polymerase II transcription subunit 17 n=1 Tax=Podospora fimiseda TaxID=252190 RepID=A0AAN7H5A2_9PEZI|nr:subunit 17 of mediator complex-domain-containing protein [Podospora fimiseda]
MSDQRPLGLRPQPPATNRVTSIREFHARMSMEPGGLKGVNQAEVGRQIEARNAAQNRTGGDDDANDAGDAVMHDATEEANEPDTSIDIIKSREEIIRLSIDATRSARTLLDATSLLLSKENPVSATTTLSPETHQRAGLGTLGLTKLAAPTVIAQERKPRNKMTIIGRRLRDMRHVARKALSASRRLRREIRAETKYWSQVQTVTDAGFRTAHLPEHQTIGVRFGFNSDKPSFADKDIAPLRRAEKGSAELVLGTYGGGSQRVQVTILEHGSVVGKSTLQQPMPEESPLRDVKEASETIFNQELWHEMNKEARLMLGRKVRLEKSAITYPISSTETISISLVSPGGADTPESEPPRPKDDLADGLNIALALQLTSAHRFREEDEGENEMHNAMGMAKAGDDDDLEYLILEPIVSYFEHEQILEQCIRQFSALLRPLSAAGLDCFVKISEKSLKQTLPPAKNCAVATTVVLLRHPEVHFDLQIAPHCRLRIMFTSSATDGTHFAVACESTSPSQPNPLIKRCPPYPKGYDEVSKLFEYLYTAVPRALAGYSEFVVQELILSVLQSGENARGWTWAFDNKGLSPYNHSDFGVYFEFSRDPATGGRVVEVRGDFNDENGQRISRTWTWPAAPGQDDDDQTASFEDVVRHVLASCPHVAEDLDEGD